VSPYIGRRDPGAAAKPVGHQRQLRPGARISLAQSIGDMHEPVCYRTSVAVTFGAGAAMDMEQAVLLSETRAAAA
jgi:hypothetical protein